jgi:ATP-dependent RNA helicase DeaD
MSSESPLCLPATWAGLALHPAAHQAMLDLGIHEPTPIQVAAMAPLLAGQDILLRSGTGTGKTLAYLLPLLHRAEQNPRQRLVILAPSPELALQILRCVEAFATPQCTSLGLVGSGSIDRQKQRLKRHPQVLVGTPGRICELIFARKIKTADIGTLVLDETDDVMSPKNAAAILEICSRPECTAQIVCASARFGEPTAQLVKAAMRPDLCRIDLEATPLHDRIAHQIVVWDSQPGISKDAALLRLIKDRQIDRAILFVNKLFSVSHLYATLREHNVAALGLSSQRSKQERAAAIAALKAGEIRILVATDTAARGLDIPDLAWVIHYEAGRDVQTYLHRAGRTGRAGKDGTSVVLAARRDTYVLQQFARQLGIQFLTP